VSPHRFGLVLKRENIFLGPHKLFGPTHHPFWYSWLVFRTSSEPQSSSPDIQASALCPEPNFPTITLAASFGWELRCHAILIVHSLLGNSTIRRLVRILELLCCGSPLHLQPGNKEGETPISDANIGEKNDP